MNILTRKKNESKHLTKKSIKIIWELLLIFAGTTATIALAGIEKRLTWEEKLLKVLAISTKVQDNKGAR